MCSHSKFWAPGNGVTELIKALGSAGGQIPRAMLTAGRWV